MNNFKEHLINEDATILEALKKLNALSAVNLTLFITDRRGIMRASLTDGDIRRALIAGAKMGDSIKNVGNKKFLFIKEDVKNKVSEIKYIRDLRSSINLLPVLDKAGKIKEVIDFNRRKNILPIDAVIMAGGRGERLRPLTDKLPKPLINVGGRPIIERNINRLNAYGIGNITISVNYLAEKIENYFKNRPDISFARESQPLGTIGAARLVKKFKSDSVLIMNSDLFTNIDFERFFLDFMKSGADMSIAAVPYNVDIPLGIMEADPDGHINALKEKPSYTHYANAGIYLIKTAALKKYLPKEGRVDATQFINLLLKNRRRVVSFPIVGYWVDIGTKEDLKKVETFAEHINTEKL